MTNTLHTRYKNKHFNNPETEKGIYKMNCLWNTCSS